MKSEKACIAEIQAAVAKCEALSDAYNKAASRYAPNMQELLDQEMAAHNEVSVLRRRYFMRFGDYPMA